MLLKVSTLTYASMALDLMRGYYNIELSDDAKKLSTITTWFGKYEYNQLPMGVRISPVVFQEDQICQLFEDLETVWTYIDDLLVVVSSGTFEEHINNLDISMKRLHDARLK